MKNVPHSLDSKYFDDVYSANEDPWQFETSEYERKKYEETIHALQGKKFRHAFEIGCSIGVLTKMLLPHCEHILAVDPADLALAKAKLRLENNPSVDFKKMMVPKDFPVTSFDLIVLSEVGYYLNMDDLKILAKKIMDHLEKGGNLLMVHWTDFVADYPLTGDEVHNYFLEVGQKENTLKHSLNKKHEKYRLDYFEKI